VTAERILLVDDEEDLLRGLRRTLERRFPGVEVATATRPDEALDLAARQSFDLALLDVMMPGMTGIELLEKLKARDALLSVVMMTAFASVELAVEAIKKGAYDFITKPFDKDVLMRVVAKGLERNRLVRENSTLKEAVCRKDALGALVGQSPTMAQFRERLQTIALSDYTVLVRGESGTGKELAARALHGLSKRRNHPLIMVNCPAIPEQLLESELFGHKRGAFTGADRDHPGLFLEADGGSLCLDEIGDIPVGVQTKLLRVLQEQEIRPLGDTKTRKVDVRIIAITNQDLESKIAGHTFREDLFYRLNVVTLTTPSLARLRGDIPLLVDHFSRLVSCEQGCDEKKFSSEAVVALASRAWPGNVRELQNAVKEAVLFSREKTVTAADIQALLPAGNGMNSPPPVWFAAGDGDYPSYKMVKEQLLRQFTSQYVAGLLQHTEGNVSRAADLSGLTRAALQKILHRSSIKASSYRQPED
jgi:DNA-binding NtrC family response regulator